jgi:protein SCO1/2
MKTPRLAWLSLLLALSAGVAPVRSTQPPPPPADLSQRVGFDQKLGATLPLDAHFVDADGHAASLARWIGDRPALLMLGYFRCPNLCDASMQALAHALVRAKLKPGKDVDVLFVSIDPRESMADARHSRAMVATMAPRAEASSWRFLRGDAAAVRALAQAAGFRYWYDPRLKQFVHPAGLVVVSDRGRVSQYLLGLDYPPRTLQLAVAAASHHLLGHLVDRLVLLCCGYDPATGRYTVVITRVMAWLGSASLLALLLWLGWLQRRNRRRA